MNDPSDCRIEPDDDPALEVVLSPLRAIEPPLAARIKNRLAVAEALGSFTNVGRRPGLPWWRRTVSVPLPVAACLLLICALGVSSRFRGDDGTSPMQTAAHDQRPLSAKILARRPPLLTVNPTFIPSWCTANPRHTCVESAN